MSLRMDRGWWHDVFVATRDARTPEALARIVDRFVRSVGFEWFSYGMQISTGTHLVSMEVLDSFPRSWLLHYIDRSYVDHDPTLRLCARDGAPVVWSDVVFSGQGAAQLWADARSFNVRSGVSLPTWSRGVFGMLSAARSIERIESAELADVIPRLTWIADNVHRAMHALVATRALQEEGAGALSPRELEVLGWTADGKTAWEIGCILGIKERTVNFHVTNAVRKLGAQNKVHAAVKALSLGIVSPRQSGLVLRFRSRRGGPWQS